MTKIEPTVWHGCYEDGWKGFLSDASMAHPAKFSKALIERIYDHLLERGYIQRGDAVGDPFGGVGTGALIAAYRGLFHISVELEPRFFDLAHENLARHADKLRALGCPHPLFIQGDSRKFHELVTEALSAIVSSPPYADSVNSSKSGIDWDKAKRPERWTRTNSRIACQAAAEHKMEYGSTEGQVGALKSGEIGAIISSPPYAPNAKSDRTQESRDERRGFRQGAGGFRSSETFGQTEGQVGSMPEGNLDAVISSPPYAGIAAGAGGLNTKPPRNADDQSGRSAASASQSGNWSKELLRYGESEGQVARAPEGCVLDAIATSPPYLGGGHHPDQTGSWNTNGRGQGGEKAVADYGDTEGQIGKADKETYWVAMKKIWSSCFLSLHPGGCIAVVVKDYCSGGKRVRLCDDTATLLEHCGFVVVERIHAMLVSEERHDDFFDGETVKKKERKSFFRRLYEAKVPEGDERRIDFEEVIIARKPA